MKKSFIALAVLGAFAGVASAQTSVTLSGKLGMSYQQNTAGAKGLAMSDGDLRVTAVEDLGGGLRAAAFAEFSNRGRNHSPSGRDAALSLTGGFGTVTLGSVESANGIIGRGFAGAPVSLADGFDGLVLAAPANVDYLQYTTPSMGGLTGKLVYTDSVDATATTAASPVQAGGGRGPLQAVQVGADYNAGPISAGLDFTSYRGTAAAGADAATGLGNRVRVSGSYDLGVAKLGAGYQKSSGASAQYALGVSAPIGALNVGAIYARNGAAVGDATARSARSGWGIGANYSLSKRTVLNTSYGKVSGGNAATLAETAQYRVRLMHSF